MRFLDDDQERCMTPHDENLPDASTSPFEFALIALDLVDNEAFEIDKDVTIDPASLEGGFSLEYELGADMRFVLTHDQNSRRFVATAGTAQPVQDIARLHLALTMNSQMPAHRRFAMNPVSQCLELSQWWPVEGLVLSDFAVGIRYLIHAMQAFGAPLTPLTPPERDVSLFHLKV
jgi:hypothetical protein